MLSAFTMSQSKTGHMGFFNKQSHSNSEKPAEGKPEAGQLKTAPSPITIPSKRSNFVIAFIGRTGSSYIIDMLNSHHNVVAERELLVAPDTAEKEHDTLQKLYMAGREPHIQAVGFKTKLTDVTDLPQFFRMLDEFNLKVIYLYRDNVIKQTVSRINRKRLHDHTQLHNLEKDVPALPAFDIPEEEFKQWFEQTHHRSAEIHEYMHRVKRPQLRISYEDLLADHDKVFERIFAFLEVDPQPMESKLVKNTSDNLRDVLTNFDELRALYRDTPFEKMFDE